MNSEIKLKYCSLCLNKKFDPNNGLSCGLESEPIIDNNICPKYSANQELIERTNYNARQTKKKDSFKSRIENYKSVIQIGIAVICFGSLGINWLSLESDYRYTLAQVHVTHQSGSDLPFARASYICDFEYSFILNGIVYDNKGSLGGHGIYQFNRLTKPIWPKKFLVKYNVDDPTLNEVIDQTDVSNLDFDEVPPNGIHPDSINFYLNYQ